MPNIPIDIDENRNLLDIDETNNLVKNESKTESESRNESESDNALLPSIPFESYPGLCQLMPDHGSVECISLPDPIQTSTPPESETKIDSESETDTTSEYFVSDAYRFIMHDDGTLDACKQSDVVRINNSYVREHALDLELNRHASNKEDKYRTAPVSEHMTVVSAHESMVVPSMACTPSDAWYGRSDDLQDDLESESISCMKHEIKTERQNSNVERSHDNSNVSDTDTKSLNNETESNEWHSETESETETNGTETENETESEFYSIHQRSQVESAIRKYDNKDIRWSSQGMLRLNPDAMRQLFTPTLNSIKDAIGDVLNNPNVRGMMIFSVF